MKTRTPETANINQPIVGGSVDFELAGKITAKPADQWLQTTMKLLKTCMWSNRKKEPPADWDGDREMRNTLLTMPWPKRKQRLDDISRTVEWLTANSSRIIAHN